jgi:PAS domain S-box-containing protein
MIEPADKSLLKEQMIAASEQRFRALVTATSDVIYSMNPDWSVMRELDGRGLVKDSPEPTADWRSQNMYPEDIEKINAAIAKAIQSKSVFELEHRVIRADGSIGWTFSRAVPILDDKGEIIEWFGVASDITQRKLAEKALQELSEQSEQQKRFYETIIAGTPDLIYVFDLNYRFTYANTALLNMWGKTWENAVGKRLLENGYEPWHAEMHEREIDQVIATKQPIRGEVSFPHATLGKRFYDYIFTPVLNEHGEVEAVAGTTRDITERKEDEQRKNDFIGMVSHELKTPLTSLTAILQLLKAKLKKNEDAFVPGALEKANQQVKKMTTMINGFLNISRLESGKIDINKQPFIIGDLVKEVIEETNLTGVSHLIELNICDKMVVNADRDKIGSVLSNLFSNAVKYSPKGSRIEVNCQKSDKEICVSVKDEGLGIRPEDREKVFDRFYRVESHYTSNIAGFGIGLYLSAEIIQRHNGRIWVESEKGKGSTFYFCLPLKNA